MQVVKHPIWAILRRQGRTKAWLAREIGYSYPHLLNVAGGAFPTTPAFREKCASALQMPVDLLFDDAADERARERAAKRVRRRQPVTVA